MASNFEKQMVDQFITYREKDKDGILQYYILQKAFPHYIGRIVYSPPAKYICLAPIPRYNMFVVFRGQLEGNRIHFHNEWQKELPAIILAMADWFYTNRIAVAPKKYERFLHKLTD